MDKIFAITDIHFGPQIESRNHPGFFRQQSDQALDELKLLTQFIPSDINLSLQMGDLVRCTFGKKTNKDINNYLNISQTISQIFPNIINLNGNHDTEFRVKPSSNIKKLN